MAAMAAYMRAYEIIQQTITTLDEPLSLFEAEAITLRLDYLTRTLVNLDGRLAQTDAIVRLLEESISYLNDMDESAGAIEFAPKIFSGNRGRPSFEIREEQLSFLIDQGFTVPRIAQLFRVSTRTIERRMTQYGLSISGRFYINNRP